MCHPFPHLVLHKSGCILLVFQAGLTNLHPNRQISFSTCTPFPTYHLVYLVTGTYFLEVCLPNQETRLHEGEKDWNKNKSKTKLIQRRKSSYTKLTLPTWSWKEFSTDDLTRPACFWLSLQQRITSALVWVWILNLILNCWPWASYLIFLSLSFLSCKVRTIIGPILWDCSED